jgi:DNA polymerase III epsilon subunit-like protein
MYLTKQTIKKHWDSFEYVVLDLEGTGAQHKEMEGIVDIAAILVRNGQVTSEFYQRLLDPSIMIPPFISRIHGIYDKDVVGKPLFEDIRLELEGFLADHILVAHNACVERRVLKPKLPAYRPPAILDTLKLSKALFKQSPKHGLDQLINLCKLDSTLSQLGHQKRHTAYYDAMATAHAFVYMVKEASSDVTTLEDLLNLCALESHIQDNISSLPLNTQYKLF